MNDMTQLSFDFGEPASLAVGKPSVLDAMLQKIAALKQWEPQIVTALHHGADTHTFDDICAMVLTDRLALFVYPKCFLLMEVVAYPQYKVLHCFIAGGDMQAVLDSEKEMMALAKTLGCKRLSFAGREGWLRVHKNNGWFPVCSTLYKEVV